MSYPFIVKRERLTDGSVLFGVYVMRSDGQRIASTPRESDAEVIADRLNTVLNQFSDDHPTTFSIDV